MAKKLTKKAAQISPATVQSVVKMLKSLKAMKAAPLAQPGAAQQLLDMLAKSRGAVGGLGKVTDPVAALGKTISKLGSSPAYAQGFLHKCAELGVDPEALLEKLSKCKAHGGKKKNGKKKKAK
jgi:hypothetical protein